MRELTREEKAAIRSLVTKWCANYDREYGCLPLDCECYMLGKCWTGAYCRYFREAVLPLNPALEAALTDGPAPDLRPCAVCGRLFAPEGKRRSVRRPAPKMRGGNASATICGKGGWTVSFCRLKTRLYQGFPGAVHGGPVCFYARPPFPGPKANI